MISVSVLKETIIWPCTPRSHDHIECGTVDRETIPLEFKIFRSIQRKVYWKCLHSYLFRNWWKKDKQNQSSSSSNNIIHLIFAILWSDIHMSYVAKVISGLVIIQVLQNRVWIIDTDCFSTLYLPILFTLRRCGKQ